MHFETAAHFEGLTMMQSWKKQFNHSKRLLISNDL
jgi:hypothetical protein